MILRIGVEDRPDGRVLRPEGRLLGEGVTELRRAARQLRPTHIDLRNLFFADELAIVALRELARNGIELVGARPLIRYRLREPTVAEPTNSIRNHHD